MCFRYFVCLLICLSWALTAFVQNNAPSYFNFQASAGINFMGHNEQWIKQNKIKAIMIQEHLPSGTDWKKNVLMRVAFDDSGRVVGKYGDHPGDPLPTLDDTNFAFKYTYFYEWVGGCCYQREWTVRYYDERGKLNDPDTLSLQYGALRREIINPQRLSLCIDGRDSVSFIYGIKGQLTTMVFNGTFQTKWTFNYNPQDQLVKVSREFSNSHLGGRTTCTYIYNQLRQLEKSITQQANGLDVDDRYLYDKNGWLIKSESRLGGRLLQYFTYEYER